MQSIIQRVGRPRPSRVAGLVPGLMLALLLALLPAYAAPAETPAVATGQAFTIADPRITESSGLARDPDRNIFWTVNRTGDTGVAFAIGPDGRTQGTIEFDAAPVAQEAVAYTGGRLYLADIGDAEAQRSTITIRVITRPVPGVDRGSDFATYEFAYPDGPHDAKAMLVTENGQILIVTNAAKGAIYRAPRRLSSAVPNRLTKVADAPAWVTDATVLPSGEYALRTYVTVEVLTAELYSPVARSPLPYQPRGESVALSLTDNALLVGSAGAQSRVLRVPIPTDVQPVTAPGPKPPPSPVPSAQASVTQETPTVGVNRSGTFVALGLALLVAVAAGLLVYLRDRGSPAPPTAAAKRQWEDGEAAEAGESGDDPEATVVRPAQPRLPVRVPFPDSQHSRRARPEDPRRAQPWTPGNQGGDGRPPWQRRKRSGS